MIYASVIAHHGGANIILTGAIRDGKLLREGGRQITVVEGGGRGGEVDVGEKKKNSAAVGTSLNVTVEGAETGEKMVKVFFF